MRGPDIVRVEVRCGGGRHGFGTVPAVRALRSLIFATGLAVGLAVAAVAPAAAQQTTTTMPPVRSIPVTPAPTSTTAATSTTLRTTPATTAPAAAGAEEAASPPMADTGLPADKLVPFSFLLIALGAALTGAARRFGRARYIFA